MALDPLASLAPFEVEYTIAGQDFTIPAQPASAWLKIVLDDRMKLVDLFPGQDKSARAHLFRSLASGSLTYKEWEEMTFEVLDMVAGRRWWQAMNLINGMKEPGTWPMIYGQLMLRGLDRDRFWFAAGLVATYALCTARLYKNDRIKFDLTLDTPPAGAKPEDVIDAGEQERAFLALMAAVSGSAM